MSGTDVGDLAARIRVVDRAAATPVILHAPHASTFVPLEHRVAFTVSDDELRQEILRLTDHATDRIVDLVGGASTIVHGVSRLVIDVERFDGDDEEMNAVGMGVLYTHGSDGRPIRSLDRAGRAPLMAYYRRYGDRFAGLVDRALEAHGRAVVIDVHSYPADPLPYELHRDDRRPDLCIGSDPRHTPPSLVRAARAAFDGWATCENEPFRGTYVPLRHLGDPRVSSVMLELRRDRYLDGHDQVRPEAVEAIAERIRTLVDGCGRG